MDINELLDNLNSCIRTEGCGWKAGATSVSSLSVTQMSQRLGYVPGPGEMTLADRERRSAENLDFLTADATAKAARKSWIHQAAPVEDQGQCGSCSAFGTASTLATQANIAGIKNDWFKQMLSPAYLFYCVSQSTCPRGGVPIGPLIIAAIDKGVPWHQYFEYKPEGKECTVKKPWNGVKAGEGGGTFKKITDMKNHINKIGPLVSVFTVYDDFRYYMAGIYRPTQGAKDLGLHAISVLGYVDDFTPKYWICQNSWGTKFGIDGFFMIEQGVCGIDAQMWWMKGPTEVNGIDP